MKISGVFGRVLTLVAILLLLAAVFGCSSDNSQPVIPTDGDSPVVTADFAEGHNLFGYYTLSIDTEKMTVEAIPNHSAEVHFNVAPFLLSSCPSCIIVQVIGYDADEHIYTLQISLKNPMFKIGYDVKGIIAIDGTGEYDLLNPDVYTPLWGTMISPFRYFAKSATDYQFPPAAIHKEDFEIYISPDHTPTFNIPFAIDAHWPGIQEDCIWIQNVVVNSNGSNVTVKCDVVDSQSNIERVYADTTAFTGAETDFVNTSGNHYEATWAIGGAPGGLNRVLLSAKSQGSNVLLHNYADVWVDTSGAVLEGHIFNAVTTQSAVGTKIKVNNTGGGSSPQDTVITSTGDYVYAIEPGTYELEVITNDSFISYDKMTTVYDVVVNPDDHIVVDFGMGPSYLNDNTEQICCINGQVLNANTGAPVQFAQVSISGGSQTGGTFQSRVTDARGHYVFWKVPCKGTGGQPIQTFTIECVASGYVPAERTPVPYGWNKNTPQENFLLTPVGGECFWEDDFEGGGMEGWTFVQLQCTQMWHFHQDSELFNANVTKPADDGGMIVILPPDDTTNGRVWQPWKGTWALWYGEDDDGSFIHAWANNSPGGTSTCAHSAQALSPVIDITTLNQATMTWQQIWEIEGVDPSIAYDYLRVYIRETGGSWFLFEHSNPTVEPVPDLGGGNAKHPQTSGGFDIAPVWQAIVHNLGDLDNPDTGTVEHMSFIGKQIQFRFEFGTVDSLYNGFRGWLVDDLCLYPISIG